MGHLSLVIPHTPPRQEVENMAYPSGTAIEPLPWVDSPPHNRPAFIAPKPHVNGRRDLQPREAKVPRDSALLDLASFLDENPGPKSSRPLAVRSDATHSASHQPRRNRFVKRVFKASSLRGTQSASFSVAISSPQRPKTSANEKTQAFGREAAKRRSGSSSRFLTTPSSNKHGPPTAALNMNRRSGSSIPALGNFQDANEHQNFLSWLERELESQDQHDLSVTTGQTNQTTNRKSRERHLTVQKSDETITPPHRVVLGSLENSATPQPTSSSDNLSPEAGDPASSTQSKTSSSSPSPRPRSARFSHPSGPPMSPPPQRPLPPSPPMNSSSTSHATKPDPKSVDASEPQGTVDNSISESYRPDLEKDTDVDTNNPKTRQSGDAANSFDAVASESVVVPATYDMGAQRSTSKSDQTLGGTQGTSRRLLLNHEQDEAITGTGNDTISYAVCDTSPARTTTTIRSGSSASRSLRRQVREDRTRAKKLQHMHDKKLLASSCPTLGNEMPEPGQTSISQEPGVEKISVEPPLETKQDAVQSTSSSSGTEAPSAPPTEAQKEVPKASQELKLFPSVKKQPHRPPSLNLHSSNLRTKSKTHGGISTSATTPATLSPTTPRDIANILPSTAATSPLPFLRSVDLKLRSGHLPSPSALSPVHGTNPVNRYATQSPAHQLRSENQSPSLLPSPARSRHKTKTDVAQLIKHVSHLERENKLLEAALMAVLRTGGALNRCSCPCYCGTAANGEDASAQGKHAGNTDDMETTPKGTEYEQQQPHQGPDGCVDMAAEPMSPSAMTFMSCMTDQHGDREERWSYGTSLSGRAGSRSSGGSALALYMQTRRASGFGWNASATAAAVANARIG